MRSVPLLLLPLRGLGLPLVTPVPSQSASGASRLYAANIGGASCAMGSAPLLLSLSLSRSRPAQLLHAQRDARFHSTRGFLPRRA